MNLDTVQFQTWVLSGVATFLGGGWLRQAYRASRVLKADRRTDQIANVLDSVWRSAITGLNLQLDVLNSSLMEQAKAHQLHHESWLEQMRLKQEQIEAMRALLADLKIALDKCQDAHIMKDSEIRELRKKVTLMEDTARARLTRHR